MRSSLSRSPSSIFDPPGCRSSGDDPAICSAVDLVAQQQLWVSASPAASPSSGFFPAPG